MELVCGNHANQYRGCLRILILRTEAKRRQQKEGKMEGNLTIKNVMSFDECEPFVRDFCADNIFSDPMLSSDEEIKNNLINAIGKKDSHLVVSICMNGQMIGLFSFLALKEERYLEMLVGLSRYENAYGAMFAYLKEQFNGYSADFVFNPNNNLLYHCLEQNGAEFYEEEQRMVYNNAAPHVDTVGVELLTEPYIPAYIGMHRTDMYWTGEKILEAKNQFRTFIARENGTVVGYLDVTCCHEENEPYDLWVREEYRRKGYGRKLLAKALEMNQPKGMMLLVETHNEAAIRLFESMGFEKMENQNSVTAHLQM